MWVAKNKNNGHVLSKEFYSIYDCQNFIDNELKDKLQKANLSFAKKEVEKGHCPNLFVCLLIISNRIMCYNTEQKRYCNSFDF